MGIGADRGADSSRPRGRLARALSSRSGLAATLQTLASSILILSLNLGTGVITARLLGPAGRGELAAIVMWPQFMAFLLTFGLPSAMLYHLRCSADRGRELFSAVLLLGSVMATLAITAGVIVIPLWLTEYSPEVVRFARWAMIAAPVPLFTVTWTAMLQARDEFVLYNVVRILQPSLCLAALAGLLIAGAMTPFTAATVTLLAGLPMTLAMLARFCSIYRPFRRGTRWAAQALLSYGIRSYGADLLGALASQVDRVLVVGMLDPTLMGLYVVAVSISQMLNVFPTAVVSILFPRSSGRPVDEVIEMTGRAARLSLMATSLVAATAIAFGPLVLRVVYGEEFIGAAAVFRILLIEGVIRGLLWILAQSFMALGRPGLVSIIQGVGLVLTVPLLLLLVPRFGLEGAGYALLISTSGRFVCVLACFPLALRHAPPGLVPGPADLIGLWRRLPRPDGR